MTTTLLLYLFILLLCFHFMLFSYFLYVLFVEKGNFPCKKIYIFLVKKNLTQGNHDNAGNILFQRRKYLF